jgi:hypothetical protein
MKNVMEGDLQPCRTEPRPPYRVVLFGDREGVCSGVSGG